MKKRTHISYCLAILLLAVVSGTSLVLGTDEYDFYHDFDDEVKSAVPGSLQRPSIRYRIQNPGMPGKDYLAIYPLDRNLTCFVAYGTSGMGVWCDRL